MLDNGGDGPMKRSRLSIFPLLIALNIAGFSKTLRHLLALDISRKSANVFGKMILRPFFGLEMSNKD
jgi:hypothetical protein